MKVYGKLEAAQVETVSGVPTNNPIGRLTLETGKGTLQFGDGTGNRKVIDDVVYGYFGVQGADGTWPDGTWRITTSGAKLAFQRKDLGVWTTYNEMGE